MISFNTDHPDLITDLQDSIKFFAGVSRNINTNSTVSDLKIMMSDALHVLETLKTFIEDNEEVTENIDIIVTQSKNFTDFLTEFKNKFTHW